MKFSLDYRPDEICEEFADKGTQITIKMLGKDNLLLFEGTADALEFLGRLFLSVAFDPKDTGFQISPSGPGKLLFSSNTSFGIYIHRLD
jgi:hypothetical protein